MVRPFNSRYLVVGEQPLRDIPHEEIKVRVIEKKLRPSIPSSVPAKLSSLIEACWAQKPENRPAFTEVEDRLAALIAEFKTQNDV